MLLTSLRPFKEDSTQTTVDKWFIWYAKLFRCPSRHLITHPNKSCWWQWHISLYIYIYIYPGLMFVRVLLPIPEFWTLLMCSFGHPPLSSSKCAPCHRYKTPRMLAAKDSCEHRTVIQRNHLQSSQNKVSKKHFSVADYLSLYRLPGFCKVVLDWITKENICSHGKPCLLHIHIFRVGSYFFSWLLKMMEYSFG